MAPLEGDLLIRGGAVTAEAVRNALALRAKAGGSLDECLVRLGVIDEDRLAQFYHKRLVLPLVAEARLVNIAPAALELVPAEVAAEFRLVPIAIDSEGSLLVAMADPSDNHAVEEVGFFVDRFILRGVATASAVRRALERHYKIVSSKPKPAGTERPTRPEHRAVEDPGSRPAPPPAQPRASFVPTQVVAALPSATRRPPGAQGEQPAEPVVILTKKKRSDETPLPPHAPPPVTGIERNVLPPSRPAAPVEEPLLLTQRRGRARTATMPGLYAAAPPSEGTPPLAGLRNAVDRDEVARVLLDYAAQLLERAALFVVRRGALVGFDARGGGLDRASVEMLQVPLSGPSLFRDVAQSRLPFRGPLPDTPQNRTFARALGAAAAAEVILFPIAVRGRVVAILFGDRIAQVLPEAALQAMLHEAGLAYERILVQARVAAEDPGR